MLLPIIILNMDFYLREEIPKENHSKNSTWNLKDAMKWYLDPRLKHGN
jgi:hypothetical protein